jgi:hypothetical protein
VHGRGGNPFQSSAQGSLPAWVPIGLAALLVLLVAGYYAGHAALAKGRSARLTTRPRY